LICLSLSYSYLNFNLDGLKLSKLFVAKSSKTTGTLWPSLQSGTVDPSQLASSIYKFIIPSFENVSKKNEIPFSF